MLNPDPLLLPIDHSSNRKCSGGLHRVDNHDPQFLLGRQPVYGHARATQYQDTGSVSIDQLAPVLDYAFECLRAVRSFVNTQVQWSLARQ